MANTLEFPHRRVVSQPVEKNQQKNYCLIG
jgi:hypothetical protein